MSERMRAANCGQKFYVGSPCKNCGGTERHTVSASCVECNRRQTAERVKKIRALIKVAQGVGDVQRPNPK